MRQTERSRRNPILLILFLGVLMGALDIAIVGPALPTMRRDLGMDERAASWVFTTYVLFNLIGVPLMAKLSDEFGRRSIYALDIGLFALGSLIVALSGSFQVGTFRWGVLTMIVGRAVQGLGTGGIFPVASAVIGDIFPPEKRGSALGLIGAVFGIAFLVGPLLAGFILSLASWHWLFLVNLPLAVIVMLLGLRLLPGTRPNVQKRFDWVGMIVLAMALAMLTFGINRLDIRHVAASIATLEVGLPLVAALGLGMLFVWTERRAANPIVRVELLRSRQVAIVGALAAGAGLSEASVVFVPQFVVLAFEVSSAWASWMLLPAVVAMAVGAPLAGRMLDRHGSRVAILLGAGLTTMGLFIVSFLGTHIVFFYVSALLAGLGLGILLGAPLRYVMLNEAPATERAAAQGLLTLHSSIGQLIGGALVGAVAASLGGGVRGLTTAFLVVAFLMLTLTGLALALKSRAQELATVQTYRRCVST